MTSVTRSPCKLTWQVVFRGNVLAVKHSRAEAEAISNMLNKKYGPLIN